jgi:LPXTG-motif cell wall-anchored protein
LLRHTPKIAAAFAAGIAIACMGTSAAFAAGQLTVPSPYPMPQSSPGVIDQAAVDITGTGFTPGTFVYAQYCDGQPGNSRQWSPSTDCGPAEAALKVQQNGKVQFPGTDPNFAILVWHGDDANNPQLGEQPFNCLAADDNPRWTVTTEGAQPVDPKEPAWGSQQGANRAGGGSAPCQIRITTSLASYSPSDIFLPVDLSARGHYTGTVSSSGGTGTGAASGGGSSGSGTGAGAGSSGSGPGRNGLDPAHASSSGGFLASTGADVAGGVVIGLALIAGGTLLVRRARRRQQALHA